MDSFGWLRLTIIRPNAISARVCYIPSELHILIEWHYAEREDLIPALITPPEFLRIEIFC